jgi:hypothetical protein
MLIEVFELEFDAAYMFQHDKASSGLINVLGSKVYFDLMVHVGFGAHGEWTSVVLLLGAHWKTKDRARVIGIVYMSVLLGENIPMLYPPIPTNGTR